MASNVEPKHSEVQALADQLGSALCAALNSRTTEGGDWIHHVDTEAHYLSFSLVHPRRLALSLRHHNTHLKGSAGRRLTVECVYPPGYSGTAETTTVGLDSSTSSMASRIVTLLLPGYLKNLEVALAERRTAQENRRARQRMNREMKQALPALHPAGWETERTESSRTRSFWYASSLEDTYPPAHAGGEIRLSTDASEAEIELNRVPAPIALQILRLLNPNPATEGTVMPRGLPPSRRALSTVRSIPGEVLPAPHTRSSAGHGPHPRPEILGGNRR
ncbi:hypothetical protein [Streptomyces anthocyanicus]|uniref:hypothetical protein n=1 Tax=Streptomyces anthocyanicus TaxID=68174 RepID=UPI003812E205